MKSSNPKKDSILDDFMDLFYPRICPACSVKLNRDEIDLCFHCKADLPKTNFHLLAENPVKKVFWGRIKLDKACAYYYFTKSGKIQNLLHNIKYHGLKELAQNIGRYYGQELKDSGVFDNVDYIVPVPLHPRKLKSRGFNQSEFFGMGLSESLGITLSINNLVRKIHNPTQTKKSRYQRWENVSTIFDLNDADAFAGKRLMLIDDVITTGSTLEACAIALNKSPDVHLNIVAMAFASI
jgi:ComF family protein